MFTNQQDVFYSSLSYECVLLPCNMKQTYTFSLKLWTLISDNKETLVLLTITAASVTITAEQQASEEVKLALLEHLSL